MNISNPGDPPTKQFFIPVTFASLQTNYTYHTVGECNAASEQANMEFMVPHDFHTLIECLIFVIPRFTTAAAVWYLNCNYAGLGEAYNIHTERDLVTTYDVTDNQIFAVDASGVLTSLAAEDCVGLGLQQGAAGDNVNVLGVLFRYA